MGGDTDDLDARCDVSSLSAILGEPLKWYIYVGMGITFSGVAQWERDRLIRYHMAKSNGECC